MKTQRVRIVLGVFIVSLGALARAAMAAPPPLPSSFYGTVKVNATNVPLGTNVSAWINGAKYAETFVTIYLSDTVYSLDVPGDDPATPGVIEGGKPGDTIVFYIGNSAADQTGSWQSGTNIQRNLSRAPVPVAATITVEAVPATLIVNSGATAVITATARDISNQPIAGMLLSGSTSPATLGVLSLPNITNASGQVVGTLTAGGVAGIGLLRVSNGSITGTVPITLNNPVPTLTHVSPTTVTVGSPSFTLTVTGTNFVSSSLISWNGAPRSTTFVNSTRLQALIGSSDLVITGTVPVTVFNPAPGGGPSNTLMVAIEQPKKLIYLPLIVRNYPTSTALPIAQFKQVLRWMPPTILVYAP